MIAATPPELIDIGANLSHESFSHDLGAVMHSAWTAGVRRMVVTGTSVASSQAALLLHEAHPTRLFATAGVHPHHASELDAGAIEALEQLLAHPGVVAIGECGLDYFRNFSPREAQLAAFRAQLELATRIRKPVFLHQRDAHADFIAVVREFRSGLTAGVAHCFTGHANELDDYLEAGLAIGMTGWICDERRGQHLLSLVQRIPADKLMIESDAPYLMPRSLRPRPASRRNEPAFLTEVARVVATARQEDFATFASSSTDTAVQFFNLP
jgi:TatD DNase family protein